MKRSIVPIGFEVTAHPIFFQFRPPSGTSPDTSPTPPTDSTSCPSQYEHPVIKSNNNIPHAHDVDDTTCPICLSTFADPVTLVSCCHAFCRACLMKWYHIRVACPLCKSSGNYFLESDLTSSPPVKLWTVVQDTVTEKPLVEAAIRSHLTRFAPIHSLSMKRKAPSPHIDEIAAVENGLAEALQLLQDIDSHAFKRRP